MATLCGSGCEKDAGAAESRLLVWSLPDLKVVGELEPNPDDMGAGAIYSAEFNADGSRLAITTHNEVTLWRTEDLSEIARTGVAAVYGGIEFSPDGRYLATTGVFGTVIVLDARTGEELLVDALHNGAASYSAGLLWTKDSRRLYAEGNAEVGYFEPHAKTRKLKKLPSVGAGEGWVHLSEDQKHLIVASLHDCAIRVLASSSLAVEHRFEGKRGACTATFSPDSSALAVVHTDGSVEVVPLGRTAAAPTVVTPPAPEPARTGQLSFSPDGKRLFWVSAAASGVWNLQKKAPDASPALPVQGARWRDASVLEVDRDERGELFDVDNNVILPGEPDRGSLATPFADLRAFVNGDLELTKADGTSLVVRAVHDGRWQIAIIDPIGGRAAGSESLLASDAYDAARGGGAPYELAPDLGRSFFAGLALETKKP
jgi:WD40 repeat protein